MKGLFDFHLIELRKLRISDICDQKSITNLFFFKIHYQVNWHNTNKSGTCLLHMLTTISRNQYSSPTCPTPIKNAIPSERLRTHHIVWQLHLEVGLFPLLFVAFDELVQDSWYHDFQHSADVFQPLLIAVAASFPKIKSRNWERSLQEIKFKRKEKNKNYSIGSNDCSWFILIVPIATWGANSHCEEAGICR